MDLLLLPGNSPKNKVWIEEVESVLDSHFDETVVMYYCHWCMGSSRIDLDLELSELEPLVEDLEEYAVFGKSAGVLLSLLAIAEGVISPKLCFFAGSAFGMAKRLCYPYEEWLEELAGSKIPALFVQKEKDPAFCFESLVKAVKAAGVEITKGEREAQMITEQGKSSKRGSKLVMISGTDHDYSDVKMLEKEIVQFMEERGVS